MLKLDVIEMTFHTSVKRNKKLSILLITTSYVNLSYSVRN